MLRITRRSDDQREQPRDVWTRRAPKNPPRITHFEVHVRETAGYARWEIADVCGETLECSLQFSKDGGKSWNGLAVALTGTEYHFDLTTLPRDEVVFALLVHDGFFTTKSISAPVCLPARPPVVAIMHPHDGDTLFAGHPLRLWASVMTGSSRLIEDRACRWMLDGHEVAHGLEAWIVTPDEGEHRCTVLVEDEGQRAEATVPFTVKGGLIRESQDEACR